MHARESLGRLGNLREARSGENTAINAAENLAHEFDDGVVLEVRAVNAHSADVCREEAGAIDIPNVIGLRLGVDGRRSGGEAAAAEAAGAEVFQPCGGAQHGIASAEKSGDAIAKIHDCGAIVVIGRTGIEEVIIHIRCDHEKLVKKSNEERLVFAGPGSRHGFLDYVIAHAVGNEGNLGFAGFLGIAPGTNGVALFLDQPVEELRKNVSEVAGAFAGVGAIRQITDDASERRPIVEDAKTKAPGPAEKAVAHVRVEVGGGGEGIVKTVDENVDMALVFVLLVR